MDYSYGNGTALNEANLTEGAGLKYPTSAGVDWNGNGNTTNTALNMDVNFNGTIESYNDFNDWGALNFIFASKYSGIANGPGGVSKESFSFANSDLQKIVEETPVALPHLLLR